MKRLAKGIAIWLLAVAVYTLFFRFTVWVRYAPRPEGSSYLDGYLPQAADIHLRADIVRLWLYQIEISPDGEGVVLDYALWTIAPLQYSGAEIGANLAVKEADGSWCSRGGSGGELSDGRISYQSIFVPVEPGQDFIQLRFGRLEETELKVPIDWGEWYEAHPNP